MSDAQFSKITLAAVLRTDLRKTKAEGGGDPLEGGCNNPCQRLSQIGLGGGGGDKSDKDQNLETF